MQRIVLLNVRLIVQNCQSRIFLENTFQKSEAKKREKKNKSNHKRRIKIDSVEYIILRRVFLRKKRQRYASCIYVCLHWPSLENFINKREKVRRKWSYYNLQISLLKTMLKTMLKTKIYELKKYLGSLELYNI